MVFTVLVLTSFTAVFLPFHTALRHTPAGATYSFAGGYLPDYFQYLGWIKDGLMGHFFLSSRYTDTVSPAVFMQPLFSLTGLTGRLIGVTSAPLLYLYLRLFSLAVFLSSVLLLIRKTFRRVSHRIMALVCFAAATAVWHFGPRGISDPIPWVSSFSVIGKIDLPPHHLLALALMTPAVLIASGNSPTRRRTGILIFCTILCGMLNPTALMMLLAIYAVLGVAGLRPGAPASGRKWLWLLPVFLTGAGVLLYDYLVFRTVPPWSVMYERMKAFNPPVGIADYIAALGPALLLGAIGAVSLRGKNAIHTALVSWAFLPLALFPVRGLIGINESRLFQSYQYIPLAVLATSGILTLSSLFKRFIAARLTEACIIGFLVVYAAVPFISSVPSLSAVPDPSWFPYYIPSSLAAAFRYLDTHTPAGSVVLAGEYVSAMIPAYSHNRTLIARDDISEDYYTRRDLVFAFLNGQMNTSEAEAFLNGYHVSYVLYGIDAPPPPPHTAEPYLHPVFEAGGISLMQVKR